MLADRVNRYGQSLSDDDVPSAVAHEVKRRKVDSQGCVLGTLTAPPCRIARHVTAPHDAILWSTGHRTLPDLAAFANGAARSLVRSPRSRRRTPCTDGHSASALPCHICLFPHHRQGHVIGQRNHTRLIRPRARYTGPPTRDYVPLNRRR
jgi:hypothetical protein